MGCARAQLTHSCTSVLNLAALRPDIGSGDEAAFPNFRADAEPFRLARCGSDLGDIREAPIPVCAIVGIADAATFGSLMTRHEEEA